MTEPRIIATIDARNGYDGAIVAVRARMAETGTTCAKIDELAGVPAGYTAKLVGDARPKQFSLDSWLAILAALALANDLRPDPQQEALMRPHWEPGQDLLRRTLRKAPVGRVTIRRMLPVIAKEMQKRGSAVRSHNLSPSQRSAIARKAGKASGRARLRKGLMEMANNSRRTEG